MKEAIYKIKGVEVNSIKQNSPLDIWFCEMVQKNVDELTIRDVSCMLRQEMYLDIAIPIAWWNIITNPFCGEMYEGQMIELLMRVFINNPELKEIESYIMFQKNLEKVYEIHNWDNDYAKEEYKKIIMKFQRLFK